MGTLDTFSAGVILFQGRDISALGWQERVAIKTHRKKMKEYIEFITGNDNLATSMFSVGDGVAVSILK